MRIRSLEKPSPRQSTSDEVDLEKNKQDNGMMFAPQEVLEFFSREKKKEARDLSGAVRRARHERKERGPSPGPLTVPLTQPRSSDVQKNQKAATNAITRQGLLDVMEELDNANEAGTEEEIPVFVLRRSQRQASFEVTSKRE